MFGKSNKSSGNDFAKSIESFLATIYPYTITHFNEMATNRDSPQYVRDLISRVAKDHPSFAWQRILFQMGSFLTHTMIVEMQNMNNGYRNEIGNQLSAGLIRKYAEKATAVVKGPSDQIVRQLEAGFEEEERRAVAVFNDSSSIAFLGRNDLSNLDYTRDEIARFDLSDNLAGCSSILICTIANEVANVNLGGEHYVGVALSLLELYIRIGLGSESVAHQLLASSR